METGSQYRWTPTVLWPNLRVLGLPALALWLLQDRIQTVRHQVERNMPGIAWLLCWWIAISAMKDDLHTLVWGIELICGACCNVSCQVILTLLLMIVPSSRYRWPGPGSSPLSLLQETVQCTVYIYRPHWIFSVFFFIIKHLDRATPLEEYSRIQCPTLGAPDNTWQPAQSVTKWVIWSNNLEISYKQQIHLDIQPPEQVDAKDQAKNFQKHHALKLSWKFVFKYLLFKILFMDLAFWLEMTSVLASTAQWVRWANQKVIDLLITESLQH